AIDETERRRAIQQDYNTQHNITPFSIIKQVRDLTDRVKSQIAEEDKRAENAAELSPESLTLSELDKMVKELERAMKAAAKDLEFEKAAALRDQVIELRRVMVLKQTTPEDSEEPVAVGANPFDEEVL